MHYRRYNSNLRSALDHLAYDLWIKESNTRGQESRIYFPIDKDEVAYNRNKAGKTQGISSRSRSIIDSLKPYKNGNDSLWRIHTLNNRDKHRLLVTVGSSFQSVDIGAHMLQSMRKMPNAPRDILSNLPDLSLFLKPADNLFPLKVGEELFIGGEDDKEDPGMQFRFNVLLYEPGVIDGESVIESLASMIVEVERIGPLFDL